MNIEERFMKVILPIIQDKNSVSLDQEFKDININSIIYIKLSDNFNHKCRRE